MKIFLAKPVPHPVDSQRGMTLVVSLIMLVILTMFAISTMNLSNSNLRVVGNQQAQRAVEAAAQQAIEQVLSGSAIFLVPAAQTLTINGFTVAVTSPVCVRSKGCNGCSIVLGTADLMPDMNLYELQASTTDPLTGATASVFQGVDLMQPAKHCP